MTSFSDSTAIQALRDALHAMRRQCTVSGHRPEDIAVWLSSALLEYLFETLMAIALLLEHGHVDQAVPLLRVAVSTTTNVLAVWISDEADGVALQYLAFSQRVRHSRIKERGGRDGLDQALAEQLESDELELERHDLGRLESERGIKPVAFGNRSDTWSGLSDRALLSKVWYDDDWLRRYVDMSNASHANVAGIWHRLIDGSTSVHQPTFSYRQVADLTVSLFERAASEFARQLPTDQAEAVGRAATAFWWSAQHGQDDLDLFWDERPSKYDLDDEENRG